MFSLLMALCAAGVVLDDPEESDHYALVDISIPDDVVLEVGGLLQTDDGRLYVCTRRGDLWAIDDPLSERPRWSLWADGLAEPLGLLQGESGEILVIQRAELSALSDKDGDGHADEYLTLCDDWEISGSYHEYAFGPTRDPDGNLWVTLNRPFDNEPFGKKDWRGWAIKIDKQGNMHPVCAGLRSPAGVGVSPWGDPFYTDNQGEWCGASKLSMLSPGSFHGHPWGIASCDLPSSAVEHPGELPDGRLMPLVTQQIPHFTLPAVWFPYDVMGRSPSGFNWDLTGGAFGPFEGQLFVGDQYQASVLRVFLEQVNGRWQGACFPFRKGLASGVIRVLFADDGSLVVGCSDRGWGSLGDKSFGLQRLVYTGVMPFEMRELSALPHGFRVVFTEPVDRETAADPESWALRRFTYRLHANYGSDETDTWELEVTSATVAADGLSVNLAVSGLRAGYVHALTAAGVRSTDGRPLLHDVGFYSLIERPGEAAAPQVVIASDQATSDLARELTKGLRAGGVSCQSIAPHADPSSLAALRDASLFVLLTGELKLDEEQRAPLMTYADGGHGWLALGAGLNPLAESAADDEDGEANDDATWLAERLADSGTPWTSRKALVAAVAGESDVVTQDSLWTTGGDRQRIVAGDIEQSLPALLDAAWWALGRDAD
jgi:hypothetical protein